MKQSYIRQILAIQAPPYNIGIAKCNFHYLQNEIFTFGIDCNKKVALKKCRLEAEERYRITNIEWKRILISNATKLSNFVNPNNLFSYPKNSRVLRKLYGYVHFSPQKEWFWCLGKDVKNNKEIYLPADILYVGIGNNFEAKERKFPCAGRANSSGCALHKNLLNAKRSAILELIERDHVLAWWLLGLPSQRIIINNSNDYEIKRYMSSCTKQLIRTSTFRILIDFGIDVFVTILESDKAPFTTFGFGCDFDSIQGLKKSLREAFFIHTLLKKRMFKIYSIRSVKKIQSLSDHGMYYASKNHNKKYAKILSNSKQIDFGDLKKKEKMSYKSLIEMLYKKGNIYEFIYHRSKKEVVVRIMSNYLIPLYSAYQLRSIQKERLRDIQKFFPKKILYSTDKLNPLPHPIF